MLDAIAGCQTFAEGLDFAAFSRDPKTVKAVVWNIAVIGEAVRRLPPGLTAARPEIPRAAMRGMRNHIVHGYDTIDLELVWKVVRDEPPPLAPALETILGAAET